MKKKQRLDLLLVQRGLAASRERAASLILAGHVLVGDVPQTKAGAQVEEGAEIRLRGGKDHPYVSRGGLKLKKALEAFGIVCKDRRALDLGASTGGFTQVLLEAGARQVVAVDVGHNQLAWSLRQDPRVLSLEKVHAKDLTRELVGPGIDLAVVDVSFISLTRVFAPLTGVLMHPFDLITLIKPQFELEKADIQKGGIVREPEAHARAIERVTQAAEPLLQRMGLIESPIQGGDGNVEFLAHWRRRE